MNEGEFYISLIVLGIPAALALWIIIDDWPTKARKERDRKHQEAVKKAEALREAAGCNEIHEEDDLKTAILRERFGRGLGRDTGRDTSKDTGPNPYQ